jgi:hypothetical protein
MNFFSLDVKWRVRGWAKKYANSSLYGKLNMGGKKPTILNTVGQFVM